MSERLAIQPTCTLCRYLKTGPTLALHTTRKEALLLYYMKYEVCCL